MIVPDYTLHDEPFALTFEVFRAESGVITVERVRQQDGSHKWAIRDGWRQCLSTNGKWDFESMPSHRPEDWIATHRFDDFDAAWKLAREAGILARADYLDRVRRANEQLRQESEDR